MSDSERSRTAGERDLLLAARRGDEQAFARMVDQHRPGLQCLCYLMLGDKNDARRALSDTVLTAWEERVLVGPEMTARLWLYRVAIRVCDQAAAGTTITLGTREREFSRSELQ